MTILSRKLSDPKRLVIEEWLKENGIEDYTINSNYEIDVERDVILINKDLKEFPEYIQFGTVKGNFDCSCTQMETLRGCPRVVQGSFNCSGNQLQSPFSDRAIEVTKNVFCIGAFKELPESLEDIFHVQKGKIYTNLDLSLFDEINNFPWQILSKVSNNRYKCLGDLAKTLDVELDDKNTPTKTRWEKVPKRELEKMLKELKKMLKELKKMLKNLNKDHYLWKLYDELSTKYFTSKDTTIIIERQFTILGEYIRNKINERPKVILYTKAIQNATKSGIDAFKLLQIVYVHEMMHAFYDHDHSLLNKYIPYIEEPLTEYAMLWFMTDYGQLKDYAIAHVQEKQNSPEFCFYGFGTFLYNLLNCLNIDGISLYRNTKYRIDESDKQVKTYAKEFRFGIYPFGNELDKAAQLIKLQVSAYPLP
ncbi:MAG: hypothetical protein ACI30H_07635 [Paludibacteraceae bacterium]